ncbi:TetR/AcrR family transcriptional regulator [Amnibacterium kyonggiense]
MTQLDTAQLPAEQPEDDGAHRLGRKRDHTRDPEILDAALDVLAETGYDAMSMDLVAARAKAGKATLYRRWPSKADLVLDAVSCMKQAQSRIEDLPDTGTLRGDFIAMIRPHSMEDAERRMRVMGAVVSMLSRDPDLADAVNEAITEPRARLNRVLIERAIARGEVSADVEVDTIAHISPSMTAYRTLVQRKPVDREFLIGLIDGIVLPALGLRPGSPA